MSPKWIAGGSRDAPARKASQVSPVLSRPCQFCPFSCLPANYQLTFEFLSKFGLRSISGN